MSADSHNRSTIAQIRYCVFMQVVDYRVSIEATAQGWMQLNKLFCNQVHSCYVHKHMYNVIEFTVGHVPEFQVQLYQCKCGYE